MNPPVNDHGEHDDRELWRILGRIEASLETVKGTLSQNREADASYRTDIRKELETIKNGGGDIKADLRIAKEDIGIMKPKVDALESERHLSIATRSVATWVGRAAYAVGMILSGFIAVQLSKWLGK